jgi:hypothetical protein
MIFQNVDRSKRVSVRNNSVAAMTLVEVLMALVIVVGFFISIFEVNGICLRYIKSSKNNIAALQGVQDRLEQLRNLNFSSLTSVSAVQALMAAPANASEFLARSPTEAVTLIGYQSLANYFAGTPDPTSTQITLSPGASSAAINTTDANLSTAVLVKVIVGYTWTEALGGRPRSEQSETIISAGTKK